MPMRMRGRQPQGVALVAPRGAREKTKPPTLSLSPRVIAREPRSRETLSRFNARRAIMHFYGFSQGPPRESQSGAFISRARARGRANSSANVLCATETRLK